MKRVLCIALLMLCLTMAGMAEETAEMPLSGILRVALSSLGSITELHVTAKGPYIVEGHGTSLPEGTEMTISNQAGSLVLMTGGNTLNLGKNITLSRAAGTGAVSIREARLPQNSYPGDLICEARGQYIQVIVRVYMEDYLLGVLPYEMEEAFPLEALKAQAVAARTYALRKMNLQAESYDLVDTTYDQVYNGSPSGQTKCEQAIRETSGVVGFVNGEYMASYYTASNGGQTESPKNAWGTDAYSYLTVKDDPFDRMNPLSPSRSVSFYRDGTTSVPGLTALLTQKSGSVQGAITGVQLHSPKYDDPSRVYGKLDVTITDAFGRSATVTLDVFEELESLCGLSLSTLQNEVLEVAETVGGWKLTSRRFGHGVGLSQRGAQQMADEGLSYDLILAFYFPGVSLKRYTLTREQEAEFPEIRRMVVSLSNPLSVLLLRDRASAEGSVLAEIPHGAVINRLSEMGGWSLIQYGSLSGYVTSDSLAGLNEQADQSDLMPGMAGTATVTLSDESQVLNLRSAPTVNADVLTRLRHGAVVTVLQQYDSWSLVDTGSHTGYLLNDYLTFPQEAVTEVQDSFAGRQALVLPSAGLPLRQTADAQAAAMIMLPQGTLVDVIGSEISGMLPVSAGGITGYVTAAYVYVLPLETEKTEKVATVMAGSGLMLRRTADVNGDAVTILPYGAEVTILGEEQNGFCPVQYGSLKGYASKAYLMMRDSQKPAATPAALPTATPAPVREASRIIVGRHATVNAPGGLNLREKPRSNAPVLTVLQNGASVLITGEEENGFLPVAAGDLLGYAAASYLILEATEAPQAAALQVAATPVPTPLPTATPGPQRVAVNSRNGLNLRSAPNVNAEVLYVLPYGMVLQVLEDAGNSFLKVQWSNYTGYVAEDYVSPIGSDAGYQLTSIPAATATPAPVRVTSTPLVTLPPVLVQTGND